MYLTDRFIPAIAHVIEALGTTSNSSTNSSTNSSASSKPNANVEELEYTQFRAQTLQLLEDNAPLFTSTDICEEDYRNALFAVAAFIDEQVMNANWPEKKRWASETLQKRYFDTTRGGVEFFTRLDALNPFNPTDREIREVYYYCLALGFAGQYYQPGDKSRLAELIAANAEILCADIKVDHLLDEHKATPFTPLPKHTPVVSLTPFYVGVPVLCVVALFLFFRHGILAAVNELLLAI
ncbi:Hypothetical protein HDN1F_12120 [gamma proteobacterium HdN1]|nr:Hypothetical protein HDN1F_12120 [gamma proteobacterium HdN1]